MGFFLQLLFVSSFFGFLCSYFAYRNKKNPYLWFALGFCFGIFGLILFGLSMIVYGKQQKKSFVPSDKKSGETNILQPLSSFSLKMWYYVNKEHQQIGPISLELLTKKIHEGNEITLSTLVWNEEIPEWKKLQDLLEEKKPSTNLP